MATDFLLDTNVILYILKEDQKWEKILQRYEGADGYISIMTLMELLIGCRDDAERADIDHFVARVTIIPLTDSIARHSCMLLSALGRSLRSSHVADAIIAATAAELGIPLLTNNPRDFKRFHGVKVASA